MRLLLDTNIVIDFLNKREPYYDAARLLMLCGKVGEFELWIASNQITDIIYIATDGGRKDLWVAVSSQLQALRSFVKVFATSDKEIDRMLASKWEDPEDVLIYEVALACNAGAIITRNQNDYKRSIIKVCDASEFFDWMREDFDRDYAEISFS